MAAFALSALMLLAANSALAARIAGFHMIGGSQYLNTKLVLEELASRGHEVVMITSSAQKVKTGEKVSHTFYQVPYKKGFLEDTFLRLQLEGHPIQSFSLLPEVFSNFCEGALNSTEVTNNLKDVDLLVHDCLAVCAVLLGEKYDIPRVEIVPITPNSPAGFMHMIPMPVSYVPQLLTGLTDKMSFLERVVNLGAYIGFMVAINLGFGIPMNALKSKYNIKPERSFSEAVADAELCIITADFAMEYPQPLLPDQIMVGPLNVEGSKPLPAELEEFVSAPGTNGFIIVSFGSNVASILSKNVVDLLATAFGKLNLRVIWRLQGYIPPNLSSNIKVVDWLPQSDLLAHKNIRAFVSHVGHNSLYESAYHGVPVVAVPLFGDQPANAKKAEHYGFGVTVDYRNTDAQEVYEAIHNVVTKTSFKDKVMKISRLMKDRRRTPLQETGDWIEYVLRHGGARHLRAQVYNIHWYQYYLLDVIAFLFAVVTLVVMVTWMTCRFLCRLCCKKRREKSKFE